jgi:hypothetical protein
MYRFYIILFLAFTSLQATSQPIKISGRLIDANGGEIISGAALLLGPDEITTTSNNNGEFSFLSPRGNKTITASALGYKLNTTKFNLLNDTTLNISLHPTTFEISEVVVLGDSIKEIGITTRGNFIITRAATLDMPKHFGEPDLLKSIQMLPGVVSGRDGTSEIYVRGGGAGQNVVTANGCNFFLPGHLLGIISPYDIDFLESAELYKDYIPAEIGGGASSIINLQFKRVRTDSLRTQLRFGLLSSGFSFELPFKNSGWGLTAGLRAGNYPIYSRILKKIVSTEVEDFLPPDKYSFYDGFINVTHSSPGLGDLSYLFFGNYDNGKEENKYTSHRADTVIDYLEGMSTGWNNMVHAIQWEQPQKGNTQWKANLNYNRVTMGRKNYTETEKSFLYTDSTYYSKSLVSLYPAINNVGASVTLTGRNENFRYSAGLSHRLRLFSHNNFSLLVDGDKESKNEIGEDVIVNETSLFFSTSTDLSHKVKLEAGARLAAIQTDKTTFLVPEPRIRIAFDETGPLSPHINYVRLSQSDHSVEGSNAGLRTMLWLPVYKTLGPEVSDVISTGIQGRVKEDIVWMISGYYKKISGMTDFKPGASFIFDTTFIDMLEEIEGRAYGIEAGIMKRKGRTTGNMSYTYSRAEREWPAPEGMIWIPSVADRPHTFNVSIKYNLKPKTNLSFNWTYQSGAPATIYMHSTSYGELYDTKNNIRYFDYHRMDISLRQTIVLRNLTLFVNADIYNLYNRKNTFYFRETYDSEEQQYYFKNISLFPIMPTITLTILI